MTVKITKLRYLLLDANIIIESYKLDTWMHLIDRYNVIVPSIVAHDEAKFYSRKAGGIPESIDLPRLIGDGKITEVTATLDEISDLYAVFDSLFASRIDAGEAEALALIKAGRVEDALFCTSDAAAIKSIAMLGMSDRAISFERILSECGVTKRLENWFTEQFFRDLLRKGSINWLTGQGLTGHELLGGI